MEIAFQVERDDYCREVLKKHWPKVPCHYDITTIDWRYIKPVDLLCGGPPCQPFSLVGKRLGASDTRNCWPETVAAVRAIRPRWIFFENVVGVESYLAESVLPQLEAAGYANSPWGEIIPLDIPACAVGAPHIRHRLWIVAYATGQSVGIPGQPWQDRSVGVVDSADTESLGRQQGNQDTGRNGAGTRAKKKWAGSSHSDRWSSPPGVCRMDVRVPDWSHRIKAIGNSVVPAIPEAIGTMILDVDRGMRRR